MIFPNFQWFQDKPKKLKALYNCSLSFSVRQVVVRLQRAVPVHNGQVDVGCAGFSVGMDRCKRLGCGQRVARDRQLPSRHSVRLCRSRARQPAQAFGAMRADDQHGQIQE